MGTAGRKDKPFGPEISQYLRTTTLHDGRLASLILLVEWLELLVSESRVSKSNFVAHLKSYSHTFLRDERLKFLILTSIDSTCGCTPSAEIADELREWWIEHLVFAGRDLDTISRCLWQSFYQVKDRISVPALMTTNVSVRSACGFAVAERQHYRQAQLVLSTCLADTHGSWLADSPTRHLLLTEFVNCSNLLGESAQGESVARQATQGSHMDNRFDVACLKVALADSYISQCKYKMAIDVLTGLLGNTSVSNDVLLRIALRLTKAQRRLAREAAMPRVKTNLIGPFVNAQENISEPLRIACLEETLSVVVEACRPMTNEPTVTEVKPINEAIKAHLAAVPSNWRVDAIREALDSSSPSPFEDDDENTVNSQQLKQDSSQAWGESVSEVGFVDLPSGPYQTFPQLIVRVRAIKKGKMGTLQGRFFQPVTYEGNLVPSIYYNDHERSSAGAMTSVPSIYLTYQVESGLSQVANVDVVIVRCCVRAHGLQLLCQ